MREIAQTLTYVILITVAVIVAVCAFGVAVAVLLCKPKLED